jgi:predicted DNA-binding transcriptional regulator YafY
MPPKIDTDATSARKTLLLFTLLFFSGKRHYLPELASRLKCSKATVLRLMRGIEEAGIVSIDTGIIDRTRWYQMIALPAGAPNISLSRDEIEKLALCRDLLEHLLPDSIERIVADGITKVAVLMNHAQERASATAPKAVRMARGRIDYNPFQGHIDCLMKAVSSHTVCAVTYKTPGKDPRVFELVPMRLMVDGDALNIEGWRVTEKGTPEIRFATTLAIHRIQDCILPGAV